MEREAALSSGFAEYLLTATGKRKAGL